MKSSANLAADEQPRWGGAIAALRARCPAPIGLQRAARGGVDLSSAVDGGAPAADKDLNNLYRSLLPRKVRE